MIMGNMAYLVLECATIIVLVELLLDCAGIVGIILCWNYWNYWKNFTGVLKFFFNISIKKPWIYTVKPWILDYFQSFRMVKIQNFLQPWWRISIKKPWILDYFQSFWMVKIQNFLQPWWKIYIEKPWIVACQNIKLISGFPKVAAEMFCSPVSLKSP